ncbi:MAG: FCSD flavin-binding domain-containing protein [Alphaproteobacteria bacterium]
MLTRRHLLAGAGASLATGCLAMPAVARARPKVAIIGGGAGGLSVLRSLTALAGEAIDITLIEALETYTTCFYSNLHLGGVRSLQSLQFTYDAVAALPGVTRVRDRAEAIDRDARTVRLSGGGTVPYDRLVVTPGIDLDYASVPGWSREAETVMPHAWKAGPQTALLKRQLEAVPDGGVIVMIAPPSPYRCPPGPYERVSMMARTLTEAGKTRARIVILDPKTSFSKQPLFQRGWETHYPGMVEWLPPMIHGGVKGVDPATMSVETDFETLSGVALVNVIPRQTAGAIAVRAGLTGEQGFCPIDPFTMASRMDAQIMVLGDACDAGDMPKSSFAANSQAQVAAQRLATDLLDQPAVTAAYANTCWSLIADRDSVFVGGRYRPTAEKIAQVESDVSGLDDTGATRAANYEDSLAWYKGLTGTLFG